MEPSMIRSAAEEASDVRRALRVLIVEDDPALAALIADLLSPAYAVAIAASAEAALAHLAQVHADILVTDIEMSGRSGWQFLRQLQAQQSMLATSALVVTGRSGPAPADCARVPILHKPFSPRALRETVGHLATALTVGARSEEDRRGPQLP